MQQLESPPQSSSSNIPPQAPQLADPLREVHSSGSAHQPLGPPKVQNKPSSDQGFPLAPPRESSLPMTNGLSSGRDTASVPDTQANNREEQPPQTQLDAEGYNVAPTATDDITKAEQEAAAVE